MKIGQNVNNCYNIIIIINGPLDSIRIVKAHEFSK